MKLISMKQMVMGFAALICVCALYINAAPPVVTAGDPDIPGRINYSTVTQSVLEGAPARIAECETNAVFGTNAVATLSSTSTTTGTRLSNVETNAIWGTNAVNTLSTTSGTSVTRLFNVETNASYGTNAIVGISSALGNSAYGTNALITIIGNANYGTNATAGVVGKVNAGITMTFTNYGVGITNMGVFGNGILTNYTSIP